MSVFACADFHGCYWAWEAIKNFLKPEDRLYFLGDAADRGPDGWAIIKELLADERVTYIKGNHEDMMVQSLKWFNPKTGTLSGLVDELIYENWVYTNGGFITEKSFFDDTSISNQEKKIILNKLDNLPFLCNFKNKNGEFVYLSHAGFDPDKEAYIDQEKAIWDRKHYLSNNFRGKHNEIVVHGHTPITLLINDQIRVAKYYGKDYPFSKSEDLEPGAYWYAGGNKVDIDCGTIWSNFTVLLNLDTWDEEIFYKEKK